MLCLAWLIFTFLYQYILALGSWKELWHAMQDSIILSALWLSFASSVVTVIFGVIFGVCTGYLFAVKNFRGKALLEVLSIDVPQTFPPVAEGMIYLLMLGPQSPFNINIAYTFTALVVAKIYICTPFVISLSARKFKEIHKSEIGFTARALGATPSQVFRTIFLPLASKDILAGSALCWARAMGEIGGSLIFAGVISYKTETIPSYIVTNASSLTIGALAATILVTTASALALVAFKVITRES